MAAARWSRRRRNEAGKLLPPFAGGGVSPAACGQPPRPNSARSGCNERGVAGNIHPDPPCQYARCLCLRALLTPCRRPTKPITLQYYRLRGTKRAGTRDNVNAGIGTESGISSFVAAPVGLMTAGSAGWRRDCRCGHRTRGQKQILENSKIRIGRRDGTDTVTQYRPAPNGIERTCDQRRYTSKMGRFPVIRAIRIRGSGGDTCHPDPRIPLGSVLLRCTVVQHR
jgi:hypothetical protein